MSRIEECYKTVKEVDEAVNTLTDRVTEVSLLEDIAKSLATIADLCDK